MGVNGVNDHRLDSNEWQIPAHAVYRHKGDDSTKSRYHVYKCGCRDGYNCVAGCSPPFNGHTCRQTLNPTAYPTSAPTNYPTPYPTSIPTAYPTPSPTTYPTPSPTAYPTPEPTAYPTPQPTTYPTPSPTPYPTPYPTANPTASPTPYCPVTCETDKGAFDGKEVYGHAKGAFGKLGFFSKTLAELEGCDAKNNIHGNPFTKGKKTDKRFGGIHKNCNWDNKRSHRIVSTHNTELINEHDSLRKHRCYNYKDTCLCECLDDVSNFLDGTVQGKAAGLSSMSTRNDDVFESLLSQEGINAAGHRGANKDQYEESKASMRDAGTLWKAPNYFIQRDEIDAMRECCKPELHTDAAELIAPVSTCAEIIGATNQQIKDTVENTVEAHYSNTLIVNWLREHHCYRGQYDETNHDHFDQHKIAHDPTAQKPKPKAITQEQLKKNLKKANKAGDFCTYEEVDSVVHENVGAGLVSCNLCSKKCKGNFTENPKCTCLAKEKATKKLL